MEPLQPTWDRPSHGDIQDVIITNDGEFTSKSLSKVRLPPFAVFAKMEFPPCTLAESPTYATVQIGRKKHLNLNSDLLYINHSCRPSLIFDTGNFNILAGPDGLQPGQELTFFYPSTEWHMAQPFSCLCGETTCRKYISGAKDMARAQLEGVWLNGHIRQMLEERDAAVEAPRQANGSGKPGNGYLVSTTPEAIPKPSESSTVETSGDGVSDETSQDPTAKALREALLQAEKVVVAARTALRSYMESSAVQTEHSSGVDNGTNGTNGMKNGKPNGRHHGDFPDTAAQDGPAPPSFPAVLGSGRRGPTSRELSGEMGGDTTRA